MSGHTRGPWRSRGRSTPARSRSPIRTQELFAFLAPRLAALGYELIELREGRAEGRRLIELLVDHPDGVGAYDCQRLAKHVGVLMDKMDPVEEQYMLQVSSPGVDRPLKTVEHFERFAGHLAVVKFASEAECSQHGRRVKVRLAGVRDGRVAMVLPDTGREIEVSLTDIDRARLEPEWDD
ncbi:MAG TPA: ribosome maturation factor RimP [Armatimonadota bacterium]|nr:ribosome maturation factor RimP [Armatimonadota bacterium]